MNGGTGGLALAAFRPDGPISGRWGRVLVSPPRAPSGGSRVGWAQARGKGLSSSPAQPTRRLVVWDPWRPSTRPHTQRGAQVCAGCLRGGLLPGLCWCPYSLGRALFSFASKCPSRSPGWASPPAGPPVRVGKTVPFLKCFGEKSRWALCPS